jgi:hypothetical protein
MKLILKKEYKGQVLTCSKLVGKLVVVNDIQEHEYQFYYKNGLSFIFEYVCEDCLKRHCTCFSNRSVSDITKELAKKQVGKNGKKNEASN